MENVTSAFVEAEAELNGHASDDENGIEESPSDIEFIDDGEVEGYHTKSNGDHVHASVTQEAWKSWLQKCIKGVGRLERGKEKDQLHLQCWCVSKSLGIVATCKC